MENMCYTYPLGCGPPAPPINVGNVHPVAWARFRVLLCNIDWGGGGAAKSCISGDGLKYHFWSVSRDVWCDQPCTFCRDPAHMVALSDQWSPDSLRSLKFRILELGFTSGNAFKTIRTDTKTHGDSSETLPNTLKTVKNASETPTDTFQHLQNGQKPFKNT